MCLYEVKGYSIVTGKLRYTGYGVKADIHVLFAINPFSNNATFS